MKLLLSILAATLLGACASSSWQASQHYDEFTESKSCRVEKGSENMRAFTRGLTSTYFTQHFYAENIDGEIRAGVRTEPPLPIGGDVQIKVGSKLFTLTSEDTPIDVAPTIPMNTQIAQDTLGEAYATTMQSIAKNVQQMGSPYRAYTGEKAKELLQTMVNLNGEVIFRTVGINQATSSTGKFVVDNSFKQALANCNINL